LIRITFFTDDFEICRPDGTKAAEMQSGRFISYDREIFPLRSFGRRTAGGSVFLPAGRWAVADKSVHSGGLAFDAVEEDLRLCLKTSCTSAELYLDNGKDTCFAKMNGRAGDRYEVSLYSGKDPEKGVVRTDLSGDLGEGETAVGLEKGRILPA